MDDHEQASDLAVAAARKLLADTGTAVSDDVDLLLFASASQDMVEAATTHIVAAKLELRCPVLDVKNACNSVLNGIEVADALIGSGRYGTVLVACGEAPSRAVRWGGRVAGAVPARVPRLHALRRGGALLLTAGPLVVAGPHFCLGLPLAMAQVRLLLDAVLGAHRVRPLRVVRRRGPAAS